MCLIIHKPKDVEFSREWLVDFWRRNRDGAGVMWHDGGKVEVMKVTSPSADQWVEFYREHAQGRECLIHLRMRTHGAITEENTHPYYVGHGYWLMHNGVLASGNDADRSKSDTWHFIEDVLKPALDVNPLCLEDLDFRVELGREIGSNNRFAIMSPHHDTPLFVNYRTGVKWKGAWLANTYAWDAGRARREEQIFQAGNPKLSEMDGIKPEEKGAKQPKAPKGKPQPKKKAAVIAKPFVHKAKVIKPIPGSTAPLFYDKQTGRVVRGDGSAVSSQMFDAFGRALHRGWLKGNR